MLVVALLCCLFFAKFIALSIHYLIKRNYKGFGLFLSGAIVWFAGAVIAFYMYL